MNEDEAKILLFAAVRSAVLPIGAALHKTEAKITAKTMETIEEMRKTVDMDKMRVLMALKAEEHHEIGTE